MQAGSLFATITRQANRVFLLQIIKTSVESLVWFDVTGFEVRGSFIGRCDANNGEEVCQEGGCSDFFNHDIGCYSFPAAAEVLTAGSLDEQFGKCIQ